ncbi:MAG: 3'(2'),5'-bisphosphate nucleotidase CysQ [Candidatus Magasanikbacteria bacterium]|nr:3'(2'),5'-bisphosphate nucleotidase CysQ [Candidatus Magasanikbacteria bacterium]
MKDALYDEILTDLKQITSQAGAKILEFYAEDYTDSEKKEFPVTKADLASDSIISQGLEKYLENGFGILSEETSADKDYLNHDKVFIVDPIDGTKDFVHKTGDFSIMIAYVENGEPVVGVVFKPLGGVLYYAQKNEGAFVEVGGNSEKIEVSPQEDFTEMRLLVSRYHLRDPEIKLKEELYLADNLAMGSAGLKLCSIAAGKAHIYVNTSDKTGEWDTAAGSIILQEAGGIITDLDAKPLDFLKEKPYNTRGFVASNGTQHEQILNKLK